MFGLNSPLRLLRETWRNPTMLAEELYAMATSTDPVVRSGPVEIQVGKDEPGLRITQSERPATESAVSLAATRIRQPESRTQEVSFEGNITKAFDGFLPRPVTPDTPRSRSDVASRVEPPRRPLLDIDLPSTAVSSIPSILDRRPTASVSQDLPAFRESAQASLDALKRNEITPIEFEAPKSSATKDDYRRAAQQVDLSPTIRPVSAFPTIDFASVGGLGDTGIDRRPSPSPIVPPALVGQPAYINPAFSVAGPVSFETNPVQFSLPPLLFNSTTDSYVPLIPNTPVLIKTSQPYFGTVTSGRGDTWLVRIVRPIPDEGDTTDIVVTIPFIDEDEDAPVGMTIGPIIEFTDPSTDASEYYYQPPVWLA